MADRIKHNKRGSTYAVLGDAAFQVSRNLSPQHPDLGNGRVVIDGDEVRVYRSEVDGKLYVRFPDEFTPDRFTLIEEGPSDAERIENALQAASETHSSWEARCHAILAALGFDFGDPPTGENDPLWQHVRRFVAKQEITCAETVYQVDSVIENGYDFIAGCCDIVGYHERKED